MAASQPDRLLVVEDDTNHRQQLSERLSCGGYRVDVVDADCAIEEIRWAEYDLVLLGHGTEGGASLDLLRLLRGVRSANDLPVILVSDRSNDHRLVEALRNGANDYVVKPVHLPLVTARIEEQLSRSKIGRHKRSTHAHRGHAPRRAEGHWTWDVAANELHLSSRARRMLGIGPEESSTSTEAWLSRVHPADVERTRQEMRGHLNRQIDEFRLEHRVRNGLGRYQWILARGRVLRSADGTPVRVSGTVAAVAKPDVDALTGMGTRVLILERLGAAIAQSAETALTLLLLDLDGFSLINDSFGQETGDRILTEIAGRLQSSIADRQQIGVTHVARIGGDEFCILAEGVSQKDAAVLVESVLHTVVRPMLIDGFKISVSVSIGVFCGAPVGAAPEDLLRDGYLAMYRAKELGKNRWQMFEPELRTRARARIAMVHDLRYALERDQLRVYYQPKVNLRTRQIVGFEALIRWHHPSRGVVYPGEFIELAEDTGLIVPIGEWVLREACRQLHKWQTRFPFPSPLTMNVNLSVKQLVDPNLIAHVKAILEETKIMEGTLNLELTETALMTNLGSARATLAELRAMRVRLKLDDFGTGYSSLGYLGAMHFDSLKIDRSFVQRMTSDVESHAIVESIAKLAHALGMTLVAEGVEAEEHIEELLRVGCEVGQGFYFSTAVEAASAEQLLETSLKAPILGRPRFATE